MQSDENVSIGEDNQTNNTQARESDSELKSIHPHGLFIASLLLSAYEEFLENRRARLDAPRNSSYNRDKNICTGEGNGKLG